MAWDFSTDAEFEEKLAWARVFLTEYVEPLDYAWGRGLDEIHARQGERRRIVRWLQAQVKEHQLWAGHLGPELGGQGYGQVKLSLLNEIVGRSNWGPIIFGIQAPDTGNAEILAHYGTPAQKDKFLQPLLDGEIISCFAMTEPQAGADPRMFTASARQDNGDWVLNGQKFFATNARNAAFFIVMAVTDPGVDVLEGTSMFLVESTAPGIEVLRDIGTFGEPLGTGSHAHMLLNDVRVGEDSLLGSAGTGFLIAQRRLSGGRLHHAMRAIGKAHHAFEMMCERALSRETRGSRLADKQLVQAAIADAYMEIEQFRLFVLYTAWLMDTRGAHAARREISATKVIAARVIQAVVARAIQIHGALGVSNLTPLEHLWQYAPTLGVMDGPTEVHQVVIARETLKAHRPAIGDWPSDFLPDRVTQAEARIAEIAAESRAHQPAGA